MESADFAASSRAIREATEALGSFSAWFEKDVTAIAQKRFPQQYNSWTRELEGIRSILQRPRRIRIALVGTTGSGKSTLLNALLGQQLLPVGVMKPCTAFVTTVRYSVGPEYGLNVRYCTPEEWQRDLETLFAALQVDAAGEEIDRHLVAAARRRLQAVYGRALEEGRPERLPPLPAEVERVFSLGSAEKLVFGDSPPLLAYLRKLVRGESPLWPLIKEVNISGPYACLQGGLELVDLPGLNDPNEARVEVTRKFLRSSFFVWVVFPMVRGLTGDIQQVLKEEKLLRDIVLGGKYQAFSLVGTRMDEIDNDVCEQLGLPQDCSRRELIREYRKQTVREVQNQLVELVKDLAQPGEEGETLSRMIEVARRILVHTTSANAYNRLEGIVPLRRDFGIEDVEETGIPKIHKHLEWIARNHGTAANARAAQRRIEALRKEIAFFFRDKARGSSEKLAEARDRFAREHQAFGQKLGEARKKARERLSLFRERLLERIGPFFEQSAQGVEQAIQAWRLIHWATLKAVAQRNGVFRSPSSGRRYDFNRDIAEPLLSRLPLAWEQYFTEDLGKVTHQYSVQVAEFVNSFCEKIQLVAEMLFPQADGRFKNQLDWFQEKISLMTEESTKKVVQVVSQRRRELAERIPLVVQERMVPAYERAKSEKGSALKKRILAHLEPAATQSARPIYDAIQQDLIEGLRDLEMILHGLYKQLAGSAEEQAKQVVENANIAIQEMAEDPEIARLLAGTPFDDVPA